MKTPFIEIIEATTPDPNLLMWKFADEDKEIKNGAKLIVRESQHAMFISEGKMVDIFSPGTYTLSTENIPILSRLKGWKYGFESPFKADVYFFNTHQFINNKWGTPAPILIKDKEFGNIRIRAFGSFDLNINDVAIFFRQYAGTYSQLTIFELQNQLRDFVAPKFGEIVSSHNVSITEVAGSITELSKKIEPLLRPYFAQLGIGLTQFIVTSITLPDEVTKHFDKMTNMGMVKDIDKFTKFNTAEAIAQEGGALAQGIKDGAMLGLLLKQSQQVQTQPQEDIPAKLKQLKELFDAGILDEEEFKNKKAELLLRI